MSIVYCDKASSRDDEGVLFNFYLPGVWRNDPFTAREVAHVVRDGAMRNMNVEGSFEMRPPDGSPSSFVLTMSAVYPDGGQGYIMKIGEVADAVYGMSYTKMFKGPPESMRAHIRGWLAETIDKHRADLSALRPADAWVSLLRQDR